MSQIHARAEVMDFSPCDSLSPAKWLFRSCSSNIATKNLVVVYVNLEMPKSYTKRGFDDAGVFHSVDEPWRWKGIRMCHLTLA